ncbi:hypothetical protein LAUMK22_03997 [Mycobacterium kansasii]|nr:hypothetical protein MKANGN_28190 [Mycobacterium kansasii]VAZ62177.1 hypothetical protein LAUMK22_03997 [Mycobacterium kansasii]VAZ68612.1 hypothetical protein LAUMK40_04764 [Mycobacterium kansasii]
MHVRPWVRQPVQPRVKEPQRHLPTVGRETRSRAATSVLESPSAQASTIRARNANACADLRRSAHLVSVSHSSSVSTSSVFVRPRFVAPESSYSSTEFALTRVDNQQLQLCK